MDDWKPRLPYRRPYVADVEEEKRMVAFMVQHPRRFLTQRGTFSPDAIHFTFRVPYRRAASLARRAKVLHDRRQVRYAQNARNQAQQAAQAPAPSPDTPEVANVAPEPQEPAPEAKPKMPSWWRKRFLV